MATTTTFDEQQYQIALSMLPGIGPVITRKLLQHCGSATAVFQESKNKLLKIRGIGHATAAALQQTETLHRAEQEILFAEKHGIEIISYDDVRFPRRLRQCYDSPQIIYHKGNTDFENPRVVSLVGTRKMTTYGQALCEQLIADLSAINVVVVSGLAYGVDICTHKAALQQGLQTVGVLAHGLDQIYPSVHRSTAKKMISCGGLLTDYPSGTNPDRENFPSRNRIIAGLADATIVVESGDGGGSMISAEFANAYNRDVFAFPGRVGDPYSAGCLKLIRTHKAALIESAADVIQAMGWEPNEQKKTAVAPKEITIPLNADEEQVVNAMRDQGNVYIDELCGTLSMAPNKVASLLLQLEFSGVVKSLPGKMYRLN